MAVLHEDLLAPDVVEDPYTYFGRLREGDPVHWNDLYQTWVITQYEDVVWSLRHPEFFSSEIFIKDPKPPYPPILEEDQGLYQFNPTASLYSALCLTPFSVRQLGSVIAPLHPGHKLEDRLNRIRAQG